MKYHPFFVTLNSFQGPFRTPFRRSNFRGCWRNSAKPVGTDGQA